MTNKTLDFFRVPDSDLLEPGQDLAQASVSPVQNMAILKFVAQLQYVTACLFWLVFVSCYLAFWQPQKRAPSKTHILPVSDFGRTLRIRNLWRPLFKEIPRDRSNIHDSKGPKLTRGTRVSLDKLLC